MDDLLKKKIYQDFDKNGIYGSRGNVVINIDLDIKAATLNVEYGQKYAIQNPRFIFNYKRYNLLESDSEQFIKNYFLETINYTLKDINQILHLQCRDKVPFIILLDEVLGPKRYFISKAFVPGTVIFREHHDIEDLGNIEEIKGDIGFSGSNIQNLGRLKKIHGSLWASQSTEATKLKSLSLLEHVGEDLNLKNTLVSDFGNLEFVGGNLNLRGTSINSLGKLKFVGKNILLSKKMKGLLNFSQVKLKGTIRYYNDSSD